MSTPTSKETRSAPLGEAGPGQPIAAGRRERAGVSAGRTPDDSATADQDGEHGTSSGAAEDETYEPLDPHPDTPDDLDDDEPQRASEEAVPKDS